MFEAQQPAQQPVEVVPHVVAQRVAQGPRLQPADGPQDVVLEVLRVDQPRAPVPVPVKWTYLCPGSTRSPHSRSTGDLVAGGLRETETGLEGNRFRFF